MRQSWTTILIILAVFGLTGLTVVQIIWLRNAIAVKEQRFENSVKESLYEIAHKVQEFEYQPFVKDLIARNTESIGDLNEKGMKNAQVQGQVQQYPSGRQQIFVHIADYLDTTIMIEMDADPDAQWKSADPGEISEVSTWSLNFDIGDLPASVMVDPYEFAQRFLAQKQAVNELILKQMFSLQPITEVLDTGKLRGIIAETLNSKGIEAKFDFGITEYTPNNFVFVSDGATLKQLYKSQYSVNLFPRSMFESTKQLMLVFPDRSRYILGAVWVPLGFSTIFLSLVIGSFGLALYIIVRQKQLSEMKTDFINNMTHELKTPISTISLASQMLKDGSISASESSRLKYASVIFDENKRLGNHVEKVLQMAKMEKGEIKYNMSPVNIHDLINAAIGPFSLQAEDMHGKLITHLDAGEAIVMADELHLTNLLNNLLDNALKYNDKEVPIIEISTRSGSGSLSLRVKDNGMGMRKEELKRIFDNFYRIHKGDVHNTKGFGIGLSYVKTIVEAHRGTIGVQSQVGNGTVFTVKLPLKGVT